MTTRTVHIFNSAAMKATLAAIAVAIVLLLGARYDAKASTAGAGVEAVFGNVVAVTAPDSITVATDNGIVKLMFDADTTLIGQGVESLDDVAEGDRVIATATRLSEDSLLAARVLVQPVLSKPVTKHVFGVIVESGAGEVVIQDRDGNVVTVEVTSGIELPAVGDVVTVVASLDRVTGRLEARAFQSAEDTIQRIDDAAQSAANADDRARLAAEAEDARAKHLSVLEQARVALEQARAALEAAQGDASKAEARLLEVQAQYDRIKAQYDAWAAENDRPAPNLRLNGVLTYDQDQWAQDEGVFALTQRNSSSATAAGIEFHFTAKTQVVFAVADNSGGDSSTSGSSETGNNGYTDPVSLSDVKEKIDSGTPVIVVYNPDARPLAALQIIVLPRELDASVSYAIAAEGLSTFQGTVTLVEQNVDIDGAIGVVIVADRAGNQKVAAIVTPDTAITVDGKPATVSDLSAGHMVKVVFESAPADASGPSRSRSRAVSIDARSHEGSSDEVSVVGVIRAIDGLNRVLVIDTRDGSIKAAVPETVSITLDGVTNASFGLLRTGVLVLDGTRYNRQTGELTSLVAVSPREQAVSGTIVGLSVDPPRVVISTSTGTVATLVVSDKTQLVSTAGRPLELSDLAVGQLVEKGTYEIVQGDSGTYLQAKMLVVGGPRIFVASGAVREVDQASAVLVVDVTRSTDGSTDSLKLTTTDQSVIYKNGVQVKGLDSIEVGDIVNSVAYTSTNKIVKLAVSSPNLIQTRGTVSAVSTTRLTIKSDSGRVIALSVSSSTKLTLNGRQLDGLAAVQVGDTVTQATYIADSNDRTTGQALSITLARREGSDSQTNPPTSSTVETTLTGVISSYEPGVSLTLAGRKFRITSNTIFEGAKPEVGLVAKAIVRVGPDGTFYITFISVVASPSNDTATGSGGATATATPESDGSTDADSAIGLEGVVAQLGDGVFVINNTRIIFNRDTKIDGVLLVGSTVRVTAKRDPSGALVAIEIVVEKPSTDSNTSDGGDATTTIAIK